MPLFKPFDLLSPQVLGRIPEGSEAYIELNQIRASVVVLDGKLHRAECRDAARAMGGRRSGLLDLVTSTSGETWCSECRRVAESWISEQGGPTTGALVALGIALNGRLYNGSATDFQHERPDRRALRATQSSGLEAFETDVRAYFERDHSVTSIVEPVAEELLALTAAFNADSEDRAEINSAPHASDVAICSLVERFTDFGISAELIEVLAAFRDRPDLAKPRDSAVDGTVRRLDLARHRFQDWKSTTGPVVQVCTSDLFLEVHAPRSNALAARALEVVSDVSGRYAVLARPTSLPVRTETVALPENIETRRRVIETFTVLAEDMDPIEAARAALRLEY